MCVCEYLYIEFIQKKKLTHSLPDPSTKKYSWLLNRLNGQFDLLSPPISQEYLLTHMSIQIRHIDDACTCKKLYLNKRVSLFFFLSLLFTNNNAYFCITEKIGTVK